MTSLLRSAASAIRRAPSGNSVKGAAGAQPMPEAVRPGGMDAERGRGQACLTGASAREEPLTTSGVLGFEVKEGLSDALRSVLTRWTPPAAGGQPRIPYMMENATGGMASRESGRGFGLEIEFTLPKEGRAQALERIGQELFEAGLTPSPAQVAHTHTTLPESFSHRGGWRFEQEFLGPSGEIVSPVCFDEEETWEALAQVVEIVRRNGGDVDASTGGHIHVGVGDFGSNIAPTNALLRITQEFERELFLLATEPARGTHRGVLFCRPNLAPAEGYRSVREAREATRARITAVTTVRDSLVNLAHLHGKPSDHLEIRHWDSTVREAAMQVHIKLSVALIEAAKRLAEAPGGFQSVELSPSRASGMDLSSVDGKVARFTELLDLLFTREEDKRQVIALLGAIRFPRADA